jgi:hypothetical protein
LRQGRAKRKQRHRENPDLDARKVVKVICIRRKSYGLLRRATFKSLRDDK